MEDGGIVRTILFEVRMWWKNDVGAFADVGTTGQRSQRPTYNHTKGGLLDDLII